jgi:hypothetical protein
LTLPAATALGGVLVYTLEGDPVRLVAQNGEIKLPPRFFTTEARVVEAARRSHLPFGRDQAGL